MVERGGLENRCALRGTEGSNPSPSARKMVAGLHGIYLLPPRNFMNFYRILRGYLRMVSLRKGTMYLCLHHAPFINRIRT